MLAGGRSSCHASWIAASTSGSGGSSSARPVGRRMSKAALGRVLRRDLRDEPAAERLRRRSCVRAHPRSVERDQRIVGDEGAVGGLDRDEPRACSLLVELAQGRLLHVHRMGIGLAVEVHLLDEIVRGLAVVHDRSLDRPDGGADVRPSDVGEAQPRPLAGDGVVLGGNGREPRGREARVGMPEPERAVLGVPIVRPAAARSGQGEDVASSRSSPAASRARGRAASTSRSPGATRRATGILGGHPLRGDAVVEEPAPERGGRRPERRSFAPAASAASASPDVSAKPSILTSRPPERCVSRL